MIQKLINFFCNKNYFSNYWLASQSIHSDTDYVIFGLHHVLYGGVIPVGLVGVNYNEYDDNKSVLPVVTLKSEVKANSSGELSMD